MKFIGPCGFLFAGLTTLAAAGTVLVERLEESPTGWEHVGIPDPNQLVKLHIGLKPAEGSLLERSLYAISDSDHPNYGKQLSREAAKELLSPPRDARDAVRSWLHEAGIPSHRIRDEGQWLHIRATIDEAEGLLSTRFGVFARDGHKIVRTTQYSVPEEVRSHITAIQPTTFFHGRKRFEDSGGSSFASKWTDKRENPDRDDRLGKRGSVTLESCNDTVIPACLRKIYNMPAPKSFKKNKKSLYGIIGLEEQTAQYAQLEMFLKKFAPDQDGLNFSVALVNGATNPQGEYPSGEANLDIQYAVTVADPVPVQFISVAGENHNFNPDLDLYDTNVAYMDPWVELASYLLDLPDDKFPSVISISYGFNEQELPKPYAKHVCNMFGQLGARGMTVITGSGDDGPGPSCMSNDGKNTTKFLPGFPASCPYVTAVGGTVGNSPEVAVNFSGGGYSEYWGRPAWQDQPVREYLQKYGKQWAQYYNHNGRAFPDVSAQAWNYEEVSHGAVDKTGGTSASGPVFGAMIALINNERFNRGKPAMGFINPWIYKTGSAGFTDITQGRSVGCLGESLWGLPSPVIPNAGWEAVRGWDPVTGMGTPIFDKLWKLAV